MKNPKNISVYLSFVIISLWLLVLTSLFMDTAGETRKEIHYLDLLLASLNNSSY